MGQQQLLLIVLTVILVGIAILVGINIFDSNSEATNRDAVIHDLHNLAYQAVAYYKKPSSFGGGGNSFAGFIIPDEIDTTGNGIYTISVAGNASSITFQGIGTEPGRDVSALGGKLGYTLTLDPFGNVQTNEVN